MKELFLHPKASIKTPPFSREARIEAGTLLRKLQRGETLNMPKSRPMPSIGARCHELRILDPQVDKTWRIVYRIDAKAIIVLHYFAKKSQKTPLTAIQLCQQRLKDLNTARG
ncbi:MAG: type II toxin-antitoxin system RelE/ParE family toxin [Cyanobacteria bacterium J06648_11]